MLHIARESGGERGTDATEAERQALIRLLEEHGAQ